MEIPLSFANSRLDMIDDVLWYRMTPLFGTQLSFAINGPISSFTVLENSSEILHLKKSLLHYRMKIRPIAPKLLGLKYTVSLLGLVPFAFMSGEVATEHWESLSDAFSSA